MHCFLQIIKGLSDIKIKSKRVLDIACGTGVLTVEFARQNCITTAIDLTPYAIKTTKKNLSLRGLKAEAFEDSPRALILVKDKQEALQLKEKFEAFTANTDLRIYCAYAAKNLETQHAIYHELSQYNFETGISI